MPISLRTEDTGPGGNHITLARFDVPAGIADPALRIAETRTRTTQARNEKSNDHIQIVAAAMNMIPRRILSAVFRHVDFPMKLMAGLYRRNRPSAEVTLILAREEARWQALFAQTGRNQPCPCGSGKKYKKCCLH